MTDTLSYCPLQQQFPPRWRNHSNRWCPPPKVALLVKHGRSNHSPIKEISLADQWKSTSMTFSLLSPPSDSW